MRAGLPAEAVDRVLALVDRAEYKRRQAPPGIKITPRAFGRDRRMPITNGTAASGSGRAVQAPVASGGDAGVGNGGGTYGRGSVVGCSSGRRYVAR